MYKKEMTLLITEGVEKENGIIESAVGVRFVASDGMVHGDLERFAVKELRDEQIASAAQRLVQKWLPLVSKEERHYEKAQNKESCGKFRRTPDGKWAAAE